MLLFTLTEITTPLIGWLSFSLILAILGFALFLVIKKRRAEQETTYYSKPVDLDDRYYLERDECDLYN